MKKIKRITPEYCHHYKHKLDRCYSNPLYPEAIFSEIHRILKPGGIAIVSFSNRMVNIPKEFGKTLLDKLLYLQAFMCEKISYVHWFNELVLQC